VHYRLCLLLKNITLLCVKLSIHLCCCLFHYKNLVSATLSQQICLSIAVSTLLFQHSVSALCFSNSISALLFQHSVSALCFSTVVSAFLFQHSVSTLYLSTAISALLFQHSISALLFLPFLTTNNHKTKNIQICTAVRFTILETFFFTLLRARLCSLSLHLAFTLLRCRASLFISF